MAHKDTFTFMDHVRGLRPDDVLGMGKIMLAFVPGMVYRKLNPDVWVVSETRDTARDNGYWFFKYLRENHPERKVFYPILRNCSDYQKVQPLGNTVEFGSFKHHMLYWAATRYVGTTKEHGFPHERAGMFFLLNGRTRFKYVFLNHGVARGYSSITDNNLTCYDLFIAISEQEKRTVVEINHQPEERVKAIGFCRHDNLDDSLLDKKLLLFMPTWRKALDFRHERDPKVAEEIRKSYLQSDYHTYVQGLINDDELLSFMEENDLRLVLYLHGYAQMYNEYLSSKSDRVTIAKKDDYFIQDLLKQAAFLVTDYSSVIFDFAYMKKPCCYFQFDAEEFAATQYAESEYYTYERDGFGPVLTTIGEVVDEIKAAHARGFTMADTFRKRVEAYFPSFGKDHCKKTYELVRDLK